MNLLSGPWNVQLADLLGSADEFVLLASPFITNRTANWVGECLSKKARSQRLNVLCLTNVRVDSVLAGSLELEGLAELGRVFPSFSAIHLPSLHAKVFVADCVGAIITSGNLTDGGLRKNCEYGVSIRVPALVRQVRRDFEDFALLGAPISTDEISDLAKDFAGLKETYRSQKRKLLKEAGEIFKGRIKKAEDRVLHFRARSGTNQGIFRKTILYLLSKSPLRTSDLHPLVQQIHPDLCDDSIDRVIDGMNFGKKWKHHVRSAQQALKREGVVLFDNGTWRLSPGQKQEAASRANLR